uniref:Uncharacterized protein n=1 Tax=Tetraselmis sp. GSL018 TaxID=582737 RepID=A0A061QUB0_9CHLO
MASISNYTASSREAFTACLIALGVCALCLCLGASKLKLDDTAWEAACRTGARQRTGKPPPLTPPLISLPGALCLGPRALPCLAAGAGGPEKREVADRSARAGGAGPRRGPSPQPGASSRRRRRRCSCPFPSQPGTAAAELGRPSELCWSSRRAARGAAAGYGQVHFPATWWLRFWWLWSSGWAPQRRSCLGR